MLVCFVVVPGGEGLEFAGPSDVFEEANRQAGRRVYDIRFVAEEARPITCLSGLRIIPDRTIHDADEAIDTLIVTGARDPFGPASTSLIDWLQRQAPKTRRYGAVCTGAFLLGAAGLLDRKHVTTHWHFAAALAEAFPATIVEPDRIFVRDGPMFTSAGVTAGIDLALALVEEDLGRAAALAVARWLVMFLKRPGGQSQFSIQLAAQTASRTPILDVQEWIRDNLQAKLSVRELAQRAGMSERSFARVFRSQTGITPADFVEATRVDTARRLLEETDKPLQRVASISGFGSTEALRRAFLRRLGVRPADYRSRFRSLPG
ncbi:MAG TPA: GlxA family transcriptional regulator [Stellaceae bacterium]|jgi:transcriptional regulator GlxA family with amidase domain|nr:GlxA family transcriptional regulator [Stellaceae bacterium]